MPIYSRPWCRIGHIWFGESSQSPAPWDWPLWTDSLCSLASHTRCSWTDSLSWSVRSWSLFVFPGHLTTGADRCVCVERGKYRTSTHWTRPYKPSSSSVFHRIGPSSHRGLVPEAYWILLTGRFALCNSGCKWICQGTGRIRGRSRFCHCLGARTQRSLSEGAWTGGASNSSVLLMGSQLRSVLCHRIHCHIARCRLWRIFLDLSKKHDLVKKQTRELGIGWVLGLGF